MKFKVGDKVKFLNETGGGVVSKIVSGSLVYVATTDGFELPTSTGDIIKMEAETKAEKMFSEDFDVDLSKTTGPDQSAPSVNMLGRVKSGAEEAPGYFLAFVPSDQQWYITGDLEVRLINHTKNDIVYNLLLQDDEGQYFGFEYGSVEAGSSAEIEMIEREGLPGWTDGVIQILAHSEEHAYLPLQSAFHIKASKFSSEGSYQESGLINEKAIIYRLADLKSLKMVPGKHEVVKTEVEAVVVKAGEQQRETLIGKHAVGPHAAVVDLHIGEIVDNIAGLSSHDMFLLQINYFVKTLESAMANNFRKLTYIHGIGNGVLKNAVITKLKEYEGLQDKSASLAEFGHGAIDVLIHSKSE
ncbi:MAG: hypothetical protein DRJ15_07330 [Bacteroidetes bacterium]|nr:MAG: hypothetical protein DRJ15_07330 [Bacteroidota bacterium]